MSWGLQRHLGLNLKLLPPSGGHLGSQILGILLMVLVVNVSTQVCLDLSFCVYFLTYYLDSPLSALREIKFFFPDFKPQLWYEQDEPLFRNGAYFLDEKCFIHKTR